MKLSISQTKPELAEISALLDRVRMPEYERLQAQAHLERAEAVAELFCRAAATVRSLTTRLVMRPLHRALARMA